MARTREKFKGRRESGSFIMLPHAVIEHPNFLSLSPYAVKLFIDLYGQYKGFNNGDFCAAWSLMQKRGWKSKATLQKALTELIDKGFFMLTRQGGRHQASLYAITFKSIDECGGKLDVKAGPPPATWRQLPVAPLNQPKKSETAKIKSLPQNSIKPTTINSPNTPLSRLH